MSALIAHARPNGTEVFTANGRDWNPLRLPDALYSGSQDVQGFEGRAPARPPSVVLLDDLHLLEPGQISEVLWFIRAANTGPLLLLVAYRPRQLPPALATMLHHSAAASQLEVWQIGPLSLGETRQLLGDRPDLDHIHQEGLGNPQYLKAIAGQGEARADAGAAILYELADLDLSALSVVRAAAVLDGPAPPDLLAAVASLDTVETLAALDVLSDLDLVRPIGCAGQWALRHRVLAEAIYERLAPSYLSAFHARAEAALAERSAPVIQRAYHIARALEPEKSHKVPTLIDAARESLPTAPAVAADLLQAAVPLLQTGEAQWHEAQVLLAHASLLTGRVRESRTLLHSLRPDSPGVRELDPAAFAEAARVERLLSQYNEAAALARAGLTAVPEHDTVVAASLHTELADIALDQQHYKVALEHAEAAASIKRRHQDTAGEAHALALSSLAHLFSSQQALAETAAARATELIDSATDAAILDNLQSIYQLGFAEATLVQLMDAQRHLTRGAALSRRSGQYYVLPAILKALAEVQLRSGDLGAALATLNEAAHDAKHNDSPATTAILMQARARALLWQGRPGDVEDVHALSQRAWDIASGHSTAWAITVRSYHAEAALLSGDPIRGKWLLLDAVGGAALPRLTTWRKPRWCDALALAAQISGDERLAEQTAAIAEQCVEELPTHGRRGFALRARMRAHALRGDIEQAVLSAQLAIEDFSLRGKRIEACRTMLAAAKVSLDAGRTRDVHTWLSQAAYLASECGSARLADEAARERSRLATYAAEPNTANRLAVLSAREREIAELVSSGMTSQEVADKLHLSVRTVDSHLSRVYRKLGVPNRAALTRTVADVARQTLWQSSFVAGPVV